MFVRKLAISAITYFAFISIAFSYTIQFDRKDITISQERNYDRVSMKQLLRMNSTDPEELGKPELPYKVINLIIPQGSEVVSVDVRRHRTEGFSTNGKMLLVK